MQLWAAYRPICCLFLVSFSCGHWQPAQPVYSLWRWLCNRAKPIFLGLASPCIWVKLETRYIYPAVALLLAYLAICLSTPWPLFILEFGNPLAPADTLHSSSYPPMLFWHGHSFRIGATTTAAQACVSDSMIMQLGRCMEVFGFYTLSTSPCWIIGSYIQTPLLGWYCVFLWHDYYCDVLICNSNTYIYTIH
jgi:hypothetical protein